MIISNIPKCRQSQLLLLPANVVGVTVGLHATSVVFAVPIRSSLPLAASEEFKAKLLL